VKALRATRALRPPQKRSRMAGLQPAGAIGCNRTSVRMRHRSWSQGSGSGCKQPLLRTGQRVRAGSAVRFTHSKCGPGGWPGSHFFFGGCWSLAVGRWPNPIRRFGALARVFPLNFAFCSPILLVVSLPLASSNCESEKNLFRKVFPKRIPDIHKRYARTISFALVESPPKEHT
jgi:hypothetical protein